MLVCICVYKCVRIADMVIWRLLSLHSALKEGGLSMYGETLFDCRVPVFASCLFRVFRTGTSIFSYFRLCFFLSVVMLLFSRYRLGSVVKLVNCPSHL